MAVYSELLAKGRVLESDYSDAYTAPETGTVIVRDVVVCGSAAGTGPVLIDVISGSASSPIFHTTVADTVTSYHWSGRQVLEPGDVVRVSTLDGGCYYRISGYVLGA